MGTGTYLLQPELFRRLTAAYAAGPESGPRDWTTWLASLARAGVRIAPAYLTGKYVNINSRDDLNYANYLVRDLHFDEKRVSLVYVIDGEEDAASGPVARFAEVAEIDEVIAVARRATAELQRLAEQSKVRLVLAPSAATPIGDLVKLGFENATGSILLMSYSDDTFSPRDVGKLLVYLRDADMVVGTRTTRQMIEQGANMRGIVRAAHVVLAKLLQLLWLRFECRFTDICCVYRGLWRSTYDDHPRQPLGQRRRDLSGDGHRGPAGQAPRHRDSRQLLQPRPRVRLRQGQVPERRHLRPRAGASGPQALAGLRAGPLASAAAGGSGGAAAVERQTAGSSETAGGPQARSDEAARYRELERAWQDDVGYRLLDKPYECAGSATVFEWQFDRLIELLDPGRGGVVIEIGCGKGHFLSRVAAVPGAPARTLVGLDLSKAVFSLPGRGLAGVQADGEVLPFRSEVADYVIFDGSLHHCIDYPAALREAIRVLAPGGSLILFEPVVSRFSQLAHRLLDPIIFRSCTVYESPIDIHYKAAFHQDVVSRVLRQEGLEVRDVRSDFLAYPFTGCYAGSIFGRSERFMRFLIALERALEAVPVLGRAAHAFAWRFTVVATRPERARTVAA